MRNVHRNGQEPMRIAEQYGNTQQAPCSRRHEITTRNLPRATSDKQNGECSNNHMQHATTTCNMHPAGNTQHATCIVQHAAGNGELRRARDVQRAHATGKEQHATCNMQPQDPWSMHHACMQARCGTKFHASVALLRVARSMQHAPCSMQHAPCSVQHAPSACNIRLRRARDIQHAALKT